MKVIVTKEKVLEKENKNTDSTTTIEELLELENKNSKAISTSNNLDKIKDTGDLIETILDLSIEEEERLNALDKCYELSPNSVCIEIVKKLSLMYIMSGISVLKSFLSNVVLKTNIPIILKLLCAESLCEYEKNSDVGYDAVDFICSTMKKDLATPCKIQAINILIKSSIKKYNLKARNYFCNIIEDDSIEEEYRYKLIMDLEKITKNVYYQREACLVFLYSKNISPRYKILAGQCLLQSCKLKENKKDKVETILINIAKDDSLDTNIRADASDVILLVGKEENKSKARRIIEILGSIEEESNIKTIFTNSQNVHVKEIEDSIKEIIDYLFSDESLIPNNIEINIDKVYSDILLKAKEINTTEEDLNKINNSLTRISFDRALYGKYNCRLSAVLLKIWKIIQCSKDTKEMEKRLIEELIDMSGTCSSGYISRLVNSISGFGIINIRISWRDQIASNLLGRINAKIKSISDIEEQSEILNELTVSTSYPEKRINFLRFFRKIIASIREEMYTEFKDYISDTDYDLYFRQALFSYDCN